MVRPTLPALLLVLLCGIACPHATAQTAAFARGLASRQQPFRHGASHHVVTPRVDATSAESAPHVAVTEASARRTTTEPPTARRRVVSRPFRHGAR